MKRNIYTDGNGSSLIMVEGMGQYAPFQKYHELQQKLAQSEAQLQAQAAHMEALHEALKAFSNVKAPGGFALDTRAYDRAMADCWQNLWAVVNTKPEQALSDMQADSVALANAVLTALRGSLLDEFGNRDDDGLMPYGNLNFAIRTLVAVEPLAEKLAKK